MSALSAAAHAGAAFLFAPYTPGVLMMFCWHGRQCLRPWPASRHSPLRCITAHRTYGAEMTVTLASGGYREADACT